MVKTILSWVRENPVPDIHREIINPRAIEVRKLKRLANRFCLCRIKMDCPHIEETAGPGEEIDRLPIRRPAGFIVPVPAVGDAYPLTTRRRDDKDCRFEAP